MRKSKIILIFGLLSIMLFSLKTFAAEQNVSLTGNTEVEAGKNQTINIKITNDEPVGVIEGTIKSDSNIEIVDLKSINSNWTLTYNKANGKFNCVYAKGTKEDEILQIEYKLKNGANKRYNNN